MRSQRTALALSAINLALLVLLVGRHAIKPAGAQEAAEAPAIVRARGLEIVDEQGRVRALLAVQPPSTVDGKDYPETVLLRLIDPTSGPVVKLTAAANGSGLSLSDDADGGVLIHARDVGSYVRVVDPQGRQEEMAP